MDVKVEQGAAEVAQTVEQLRDKGLETIYSPVSQPALQTAQIIAKALGIKLKKIEEMKTGDMEVKESGECKSHQ